MMIASFWMAPVGVASRTLQKSVPTFLGNISYSLYLWHWGVIVFMKWTVGIDTIDRQLIAIVAIAGLAYGSYRFVEPFRYDKRVALWRPSRFFALCCASVLCVAALCMQLRAYKADLTITASADADIWSPYALRTNQALKCRVANPTVTFANGEHTRFLPDCVSADARHLFVVGDSHAGAYARMLHMVSGTLQRPVTLFTMGGCRLLDVDRRVLVPGCATFRREFVSALLATAVAGDTLFLPGLNTPRYRDAWGSSEDPLVIARYSRAALQVDALESSRILQKIHARGINIMFEAPKPVMPTALFRCADWFNRVNSYCAQGWSVSRDEIVQRRQATLAMITRYAQHIPGATIWDPLALLCESARCKGFRDAKPLYLDTDHLSGYGNEVLFPSFVQALATQEHAER